MNEAAELIVAGDAKFAHAQYVSGSQVNDDAIWALEFLEEARIVVKGERTWIWRTKGIEEIGQCDPLQYLIGAAVRHLVELARLQEMVVGSWAEAVVVGNERVHPVHGDELFGVRIVSSEVIRRWATRSTDAFGVRKTIKEAR